MKNSDMFWKPHMALLTDVASFLVQLAQKLAGFQACRAVHCESCCSAMLRVLRTGWPACAPRTMLRSSRSSVCHSAHHRVCLSVLPVKSGEQAEYLNPVTLLQAVEQAMDDNRYTACHTSSGLTAFAASLWPTGVTLSARRRTSCGTYVVLRFPPLLMPCQPTRPVDMAGSRCFRQFVSSQQLVWFCSKRFSTRRWRRLCSRCEAGSPGCGGLDHLRRWQLWLQRG